MATPSVVGPEQTAFKLTSTAKSFGDYFSDEKSLQTDTETVRIGDCDYKFGGEITFDADKMQARLQITSRDKKWPVYVEWGLVIGDPIHKNAFSYICSVNREYVVGQAEDGYTRTVTIKKAYRTVSKFTSPNCDAEISWIIKLMTKNPMHCYTHINEQLVQNPALIITNKDYKVTEPKTERIVSVSFS